MSRGLGKVEIEVLAAVKDLNLPDSTYGSDLVEIEHHLQGIDRHEIHMNRAGPRPELTRARRESIRRAVRSLVKKDQLERHPQLKERVRVPLSPEAAAKEAARLEKERQKSMAQVRAILGGHY